MLGAIILVHFKNKDRLYRRPHSMHFHGVRYKASSDGAFVPGVSGRDGNVRPGQTWTYRVQCIGYMNGHKILLGQTAAIAVTLP